MNNFTGPITSTSYIACVIICVIIRFRLANCTLLKLNTQSVKIHIMLSVQIYACFIKPGTLRPLVIYYFIYYCIKASFIKLLGHYYLCSVSTIDTSYAYNTMPMLPLTLCTNYISESPRNNY